MKINFYEIGSMANEAYTYAVICAMHKGELIWVRHRDRLTWEIPGGRREINEHIDETAKRELYEETGAHEFTIEAVCDYGVTRANETKYGRLYVANVEAFKNLPDLEIAEKRAYEKQPVDLTYPDIQPHLIQRVRTHLLEKWFGQVTDKKVVVVTDHQQMNLSQNMWHQVPTKTTRILNVQTEEVALLDYLDADLLIVALSVDTFVYKGYNRFFSPFHKPESHKGNYVFVRLDITWKSLTEAMQTPIDQIETTLSHYHAIPKGSTLSIKTEKGTMLTCEVLAFKAAPYKINEEDAIKNIFFPPSEIAAGIVSNSANGRIVVDMTIGQLYQNGTCLEPFGLVSDPVTIDVKNGVVDKIEGGEAGRQLADCLSKLEAEASVLVELGIGLSRMTPTGTIGIDESILGSCHFGIGDGTYFDIPNKASIHLDVVMNKPTIEIIC